MRRRDKPINKRLLAQLWGCASLAWAYFLLKGAQDPQRHAIVVEASALGFAAVGLVAVLTPMPWVRVIGILLSLEAVLLLIGRWRMAKPATTPQEPADKPSHKWRDELRESGFAPEVREMRARVTRPSSPSRL